MLKVALYGGAGSGKSTATQLFSELGVPVVDADTIAAELSARSNALLQKIKATFGSNIVKDKQLDRVLLRRIIFSDQKARQQLNDIMHPLIRSELKRRIKNLNAPYCVIVIPLLIEAQMVDLVDYIVVIDCSEQTQIQRIVARDSSSVDEARKMVEAQATRQQRLKISHQVINNSADIKHLKNQIYNLHRKWTLQTTT